MNVTEYFIGADPGSSGAIAVIDRAMNVQTYKNASELSEWQELMDRCRRPLVRGVFCETAHAGMARGASAFQSTSTFLKQGVNIGSISVALEMTFGGVVLVYPQSWMRFHDIDKRSGRDDQEWKTYLHEHALSLGWKFDVKPFPKYAADAVLIAHACMTCNGVDPVDRSKPKPKKRKKKPEVTEPPPF